MPSSRGSSSPRDQTCVSYVSCTGRQVLYYKGHQGSLLHLALLPNGTNVVIDMNSGSWALLCCITIPTASHQSILPAAQGRAAMVSSSQTGILRPRDFK